ncbi:hypothetical protein [Pseudoalteromonas rhizosphaerae]|uniref:hypothetical protein n=1 Tax=Pseudoalteromonas rhizosphaerae TaxID=2518973 RepID=UPI0021473335|nr:hypothetical protein [Pseudoalteromonas rhizosphaerae]
MKRIIIMVLTVILVGCGTTPQPTVQLEDNHFINQERKVGLYFIRGDKATTHIYGANCLLCYGVASSLTSSLDNHLESLSTDDIDSLKGLIEDEFKQRTNYVLAIDDEKLIDKLPKFKGELGFAKQDFRGLKDKYDIDILVVANIQRFGAYRSFSSYVPNGDPQGYIQGLVYTVDLNTNQYIQYKSVDEKVQPEGVWDEPAEFPGVTTAYYQAIENVKVLIRKSI